MKIGQQVGVLSDFKSISASAGIGGHLGGHVGFWKMLKGSKNLPARL